MEINISKLNLFFQVISGREQFCKLNSGADLIGKFEYKLGFPGMRIDRKLMEAFTLLNISPAELTPELLEKKFQRLLLRYPPEQNQQKYKQLLEAKELLQRKNSLYQRKIHHGWIDDKSTSKEDIKKYPETFTREDFIKLINL